MTRLLGAARPADPAPNAESRILANLEQPRRVRTRLFVPVVVTVLVMTAAAGAWVVHTVARAPAPIAHPAPVVEPPSVPKLSPVIPPHAPVHAPPIVPPPVVIAPVIQSHDSGALQAPRRDEVHIEPAPAPAVEEPPPVAERAALVARARVALHGDPQTANDLAARYIAENPNGPLVEEAYAIRIEANTGTAAAADIAADYLAKFPDGRFAKLATETRKP